MSKTAAPILLVARLLPGWNTLLHTFSLRAVGDGVDGVVGVVGLAGIVIDLWYLLLDPSPVSTLV